MLNKFFSIFSGRRKLIAVFLLILAAGLFISYNKSLFGLNQKNYKTKLSTISDLTIEISASGTIQGEQEATIGYLVTGRVASINFKEGENVKKGQIITSLDSTQYQQTVSKAEAGYLSALSTVQKVYDDIHLYQYGNNTTGETMTQKNTREIAEKARDAAYQDLQSAKKNLELTSIIAPFDGVIADINGINVGQNISAASPGSIKIIASGEMKFVANVDEIDFAYLTVGEKGEIVLDAFPEEKIEGVITKIAPSATKVTSGGSVIEVELAIPQNQKYKSGLNGEVNFTIIIKKQVLTIPKSSLRSENGQNFVYVLQQNNLVRKNISVGQSVGAQTEVLSGLNSGEEVVIGDIPK